MLYHSNPWNSRDTFHYTRFLQASSSLALGISCWLTLYFGVKAVPEHVVSALSPSRDGINNQKNDVEGGNIMFVNVTNKEVERWRAEMGCDELNS